MRKQKFILIAATLLLMLTAGCSQEKETGKIDKETLQAETLTVENDEFTFIELTNLIEKEEKEAEELFGGQKTENGYYQVQLFGDWTAIELTVQDQKITEINVSFETAGYEAINSAVAEQMGQDGEAEENSSRWTYDDKEILLKKEKNTGMLHIEKAKSN